MVIGLGAVPPSNGSRKGGTSTAGLATAGVPGSAHGLGIDVAGDELHCVELGPDGTVAGSEVVPAGDLGRIVAWAAIVGVVAIDAPAAPSTEPHRDDPELSPKFARARCCEIALGRERGIWVPWVTPSTPPFAAWIAVGFELHAALAGVAEALETFPHAVFRTLAGSRIPPKTKRAGIDARVALLRAAGLREASLSMWDHDGLDAAAAAVVALQHSAGAAEPVTCGHDGSAIWLPADLDRAGEPTA
jgi:predicted nuclease with RNAse H fold